MTAHTERDRAEQACIDGESALRRGEAAAAEKHFHEALALVDGDDAESALRVAARAHTGAGRVRLAAGELDAAVAEFERARSLRPHAAGPLHWLGCAAAHRGDLTTAETHLTAALACVVPHPRSLIQRAYVHARAGHPESARTDLLAASRTAPLDEEAHWTLAALSGRPAREVALRLRAAAVAVARAGAEPEAVTGAAAGPRGGDRAAALLEAAWGLDQDPGGFAPLYAAILVRGEGGRENGENGEAGQKGRRERRGLGEQDEPGGAGGPSGQGQRCGESGPSGPAKSVGQSEPSGQGSRWQGERSGQSGPGEPDEPDGQSESSEQGKQSGQGQPSGQGGEGGPNGPSGQAERCEPSEQSTPSGQSEHNGPGRQGAPSEHSRQTAPSSPSEHGGPSRQDEPDGQGEHNEPSRQAEQSSQRQPSGQGRQTTPSGQHEPSDQSAPAGQTTPNGHSEHNRPNRQTEHSNQHQPSGQGRQTTPSGQHEPSHQSAPAGQTTPNGHSEHNRPNRQTEHSNQHQPSGQGGQTTPSGQHEPSHQSAPAGQTTPNGHSEHNRPNRQTEQSSQRQPSGQGELSEPRRRNRPSGPCAWREVAVGGLREAARRDPADHRVTHALALVLLNSASRDQGSRWESCVAAWASLLYDDGFWERVRVSAARRYGVPVERSLIPGLRAGLREFLERRMPDGDIGTRVAPGPLLQREADAAKLLAGVGGLPSAEGDGGPLFCGPLRVAELGRTAEFGAFAAAQEERALQATLQASVAASATGAPSADSTPAPPTYAPATYTSLTYAFSELGLAQLLLGQHKAADALAALAELRCPGCRKRGGPGSGGVCEPDCARFDELNPGYAGLPGKHHRLALDARGLALEARLSMGRAELTAARPDFRAAAAYWRRALVHSRELERYRETQTAIVDMALGAARDAHRVGRLSLAVDTLEATRSVIGANERGRLEGQLARVLADRGISVANDESSLLDEPVADLRRSVAFNPHLLRAQVSLGIVLRGLAAARWSSGSLSGARDTLREAIDQLTAALAYFPADPDLEEQREAAVADLDHVMWQPDESGR